MVARKEAQPVDSPTKPDESAALDVVGSARPLSGKDALQLHELSEVSPDAFELTLPSCAGCPEDAELVSLGFLEAFFILSR
jgi:hypothetical protein